MKTSYCFIISILLFLSLISCNNNSLTPDDDQPGRRDYEWTVDTLNYPYSPIYRMWGGSPTNVWATSPGDIGRNIFHYDGTNWSTDGVMRFVIPNSIWGFSSDNVYLGGSGGMIWKYDGNDWKEVAVLQKDGNEDVVFDNMWGESPNDFYATGAYPDEDGYANNSVIAHYYNNNWEMINTNGLKGIVERFYKNKSDQKYYLQVINIGAGKYFDSTCIYERFNGGFKEIYSSIETQGAQANLSIINHEVYFILGNEIAKRVKGQFQTFLEVDNPNFYQRIWGRNSKDIFLFMTDGLVHYNGSDMEYLFHLDKPKTHINGAALFQKEVFFIIVEGQTQLNLIYHGKLKD